jgi:predicted membrane protein
VAAARTDLATPSAARGWARALSLAVAGLVSLLLLVDPYVLSGIPSARVHAGLPLMMLGIAGLFMDGLGFEPRTRALRLAFHPAAAWLFFAIGAAVIAPIM